MNKLTFTIFDSNDSVYGYLFGVTRIEAAKTVRELNKDNEKDYYFMEGYLEK